MLTRSIALLCALAAPLAALQDDVADVPSRDLRAGGNEDQRYFLIGAGEDAEAPKKGFKLCLVLPGGDGGPDFNGFVRRIWKNALGEDYLVAQLVAPKWSEEQFDSLVWPTEKHSWPDMKFSTEAFIEAVIADVEERHAIDLEHVYALGWSSGGPPTYAYSLAKGSRLTGAFVAMSVFKPDQLPSLKAAKGKAYFLLHSEQDAVCPYRMAEDAVKKLEKKKAEVKLVPYDGGHGWRGNVYGNLSAGFDWLERNHGKPAKRKKAGK